MRTLLPRPLPAKWSLWLAVACALAWPAIVSAAEASLDPAGVEFFEKHVRPLLVKRCYECHSSSGKVRGELYLDSRPGWQQGGASGPAIVPGDPDASLLIEAVRYQSLEMPPDGKLADEEIAILVQWVRRGAPDPRLQATTQGTRAPSIEEGRKFWSFQPVQRPPVPEVRNRAWPRTAADCFILYRLEREGIAPAADASPLTLLRRIYFDLTGLPPSPQDVQEFQHEARQDLRGALERLVDRLLASPHYGERWGRHWLDLARYAESVGAENNTLLYEAWRYRDYVIAAFNRDKPYDQFLLEQIAGDLLPAADAAQRDEQLVATGFLAMSPYDDARDREQALMDRVDEQIDVLGKAALGLTIACARCHDHKFDPIPTTDYYALAGIFRSTQIAKTTVYTKGLHTLVRMTFGQPLRGYDQARVDKFARVQTEYIATRRELLAAEKEYQTLLTKRRQARDPAAQAQLDARVEKARRVAEEVADRRARLGNTRIELPPMAMSLMDREAVGDCHLCIRGDIEDHGPLVPRGFLSVIPGGDSIPEGQSGRLQLAQWIVSPQNPLTARVMANRIWQHLFGRGLVSTVDNFGTTGSRPTHPELLDWLASRLVEHGWSVKRMVRELILSRTYQLASTGEQGAAQDPDNLLYWRMNRRRLEAEPLRDAILAFSGQLDRAPREKSLIHDIGPGAMRYLADQVTHDSPKRSIYLPLPRGKTPEFFDAFDGPDNLLASGERSATTVAPQALYLLNSPFVMDQARHAAESLCAVKGITHAERINLALLRSLGRPASEQDLKIAQSFFKNFAKTDGSADASSSLNAWAAFCQVLMCTAEFRYLN